MFPGNLIFSFWVEHVVICDQPDVIAQLEGRKNEASDQALSHGVVLPKALQHKNGVEAPRKAR